MAFAIGGMEVVTEEFLCKAKRTIHCSNVERRFLNGELVTFPNFESVVVFILFIRLAEVAFYQVPIASRQFGKISISFKPVMDPCEVDAVNERQSFFENLSASKDIDLVNTGLFRQVNCFFN